MTDLLDRLNRWSTQLPPSEAIPISPSEAFELALWSEEKRHWGKAPSDASIEFILTSIRANKFMLAGHRVVVL